MPENQLIPPTLTKTVIKYQPETGKKLVDGYKKSVIEVQLAKRNLNITGDGCT